jgi:hypothetical protein
MSNHHASFGPSGTHFAPPNRYGGRVQAPSSGELALPLNNGAWFLVEGTGTINRLPTTNVRTPIVLLFSGAVTLVHSTSLLMPGLANITTLAGDVMYLLPTGDGHWQCVSIDRANNTRPIVLLATGQSNIAATKTLAWTPATNLRVWNNTVGTTTSVGTAFAAADATKTGIAYKWASDIARANPSRMVYLVVAAQAGQAIAQWMSGASSPDLFNDCSINVVPALAAVGNTAIDGFMWWQGEADKAAPANYLANFETVITRFKAQSWFPPATPIVVCSLASTADTAFVENDLFNDLLETAVARDADCRKFLYTPTFSGTAVFWQTAGGTEGLGHMTAAGYDAAGADAARLFLTGSSRARLHATAIDSLARDPININGSHDISQWNVNAAVTLTSGGILLTDQWKGYCQGPTVTGQRVATPFSTRPDIAYGLKINVGTAKGSLSSGDYITVTSGVEGQRSKRLAFGSSIARPGALGIWMKSSIDLVCYIALRNASVDRTFTRRVALTANAETWVNLTYPGCVDGTWAVDNTVGFQVLLAFAAGSSLAVATADTWQTTGNVPGSDTTNLGATLNNNVIISNLMIVPGLYLPSSDHSVVAARSVENELALCQRHIEKSYDRETAVGSASITAGLCLFFVASNTIANAQNYGTIKLKQKRTNGYTATVYGYQGGAGKVSDGSLVDLAASSGFVGLPGENGFRVSNNSGGSITTSATQVFFHWAVDNSL